jgi:flavin-dependent dehydrogenase
VNQYDVVIVGAGLAGLQLARLLGRRGLRVLLVDRKPKIDQSIHTTGIFVRRTLQDFSIPEDCLGLPIRDVTVYSPSRRSLKLTSEHDEFRIGRMGQIYLRFLEQCLRTGVDWLPQTRYAEHHVVKGASFVRLESPQRSRWVRARYLVGADGAKSRVASNLALDQNQQWIVGVEEVFTGMHFTDGPNLLCFLDPQLAPGYLAWLAYDGEETHVGVGGYPAQFDPLQALNTFRNSLSSLADWNRATPVERRGGRIPVGGVLRNIANENGLLIGDAAGAVSPLTAGGLDPCMRLSTYAARVIVNYLDTQDVEALRSYSGDLFRARFVSRLWMRRLMDAFQHRALIDASFEVLRLAPFNRFARHVFFGRGSFPDMEEKLEPQPVFESFM